MKFAVQVDLAAGVGSCNCSICTKVGGIGAIAKPADFRWLTESATSTYVWGSRTATRHFCPRCGVHLALFGNLPELGGAYVAVYVNTLDNVELAGLSISYWDGRHDNWDAGPRTQPWPILAS